MVDGKDVHQGASVVASQGSLGKPQMGRAEGERPPIRLARLTKVAGDWA